MQPRQTLILAVIAALFGAFIWLYEIRGGEERAEAEQLETRLLPGLEADAVTLLEITTGDGATARLERVEGAWRIVSPIEFPASPSAVGDLLDALVHLEGEDDLTPEGELAAFGLGEDGLRVWFETSSATRQLVLGRETPVGGQRYVRVDDAAVVDLVAQHRLLAFDTSLDDLRDARVLPFETGDVDGARLRWADGEVELARRDGAWWMTSPLDTLADDERVDRLLSDLAYLRAEGFVDAGEAAPDAAAFAAPLFDAELTREGEGVATLMVAKPGDSTAGRIVVRGRDGHLFEVASERLDDWPRRVVDYRDKRLARFDASAARSFELAFDADGEGGEAATRVQAEWVAGGWVASPEPMDSQAAAGLVAALSRLQAIDVVAEALGPVEQTALGLAPARVAIRVWGEGESGASAPVLAHIALGRLRDGIGLYAKRADDEVIHLIDEDTAARLPTSLAVLREAFGAPAEEDADAPARDGLPAGHDDVEGVVEPEL